MRSGLVHLVAWFSTEFDEVPALRYLCSGWRAGKYAYTREKIDKVTCPECLADDRLGKWVVDAMKEMKGEEPDPGDD